jgi:hypothetical protein
VATYLTGVVSSLSLLSTTNTASSFAELVLLALRLIGCLEPCGSSEESPADGLTGTVHRLARSLKSPLIAPVKSAE